MSVEPQARQATGGASIRYHTPCVVVPSCTSTQISPLPQTHCTTSVTADSGMSRVYLSSDWWINQGHGSCSSRRHDSRNIAAWLWRWEESIRQAQRSGLPNPRYRSALAARQAAEQVAVLRA